MATLFSDSVGLTTQALATGDDQSAMVYIEKAWETLSRSMEECHTLVDVKVASSPVLYLPAELPITSEMASVSKRCGVRVEHLPKKIEQLGDLRAEDVATPGLLYLPHPYVVPGGRFNEMYGWDSYFIILGLLADKRTEMARGMVDNFLFEVEHYGGVLNANRTYYLTRSQPPFLTSMMRAVLGEAACFRNDAERRAWLRHAYRMAERDYALWQSGPHQAGATGLARYFDVGAGPVPEMADDSTYYADVIRWLVAHPEQNPGYLLQAPEHPNADEAAYLAHASCNPFSSKVCEHAWDSGYRLTYDFYLGDRAMRESGYDTSFRFGPFSGSTHHYAPVCLNALLYRYESDMAAFAAELNLAQDAALWQNRAVLRRAAMTKYLWSDELGIFVDYDFLARRQSGYSYATALYALWAGVASDEQAATMAGSLARFERSGGLAMSEHASGMQWDEPFGWAPANYLACEGLYDYGYRDDAKRVARAFLNTVEAGFKEDGTLREKYNVVTGSHTVEVSTGYKTNVIGFGWTNGVFRKLQELLVR